MHCQYTPCCISSSCAQPYSCTDLWQLAQLSAKSFLSSVFSLMFTVHLQQNSSFSLKNCFCFAKAHPKLANLLLSFSIGCIPCASHSGQRKWPFTLLSAACLVFIQCKWYCAVHPAHGIRPLDLPCVLHMLHMVLRIASHIYVSIYKHAPSFVVVSFCVSISNGCGFFALWCEDAQHAPHAEGINPSAWHWALLPCLDSVFS